MKEKIKSLRKQRDIILAAMASNALQLMAIESELQRVETLAPRDLPPPLVAIFVGILIQFLTEMGAAMERSGPSVLKPIPAVVSGAETTKEPESKPIVADSEAEENSASGNFFSERRFPGISSGKMLWPGASADPLNTPPRYSF